MKFLPPPRNVNNCTVKQSTKESHHSGVLSVAQIAVFVSLALNAATAHAVDTIYMGGGEIKGEIDGNVDYTERAEGSMTEGLGVMGKITGTLTARNGYEILPNDPKPHEWTAWVNVFDGADIGTVHFKKNDKSEIGYGILDGTKFGVEETKGDYQGYHIGTITADSEMHVVQLLLTGGYKNKIDKVDVPVMIPGALAGMFASSAQVGDVTIGNVLKNPFDDEDHPHDASFDIAGSMKSLKIEGGTINDIMLWSYDGNDYQVHTATLGSSNPKELKDNVALHVGAKFGSIFLKPRTQILGNIQLSGIHDPNLTKNEIPGIDAKANAIVNLGTIAGSLTNSGTGDITILNRGTFTADGNKPNLIIPQGDKGSFTINEWNVVIESNPGQTDHKANRDRVSRNTAMIVDGATQDNFKVKKVVINKLNSTYPEPYIDMKTAILNKDGDPLWKLEATNDAEKWKPDSIGTVEFSPELQAYGLTGTYYPEKGVFGTDLEVKQTASSILAQSLVNSLARRQVFVEAALADVSQSGLYHSMEYQQGHTWFVKPYYALDKTDLTGGNSLKGHTTGVLLGTNAMPDRENLVSWYAGYETTDGNAQVLNLNMRTAYMGGKYVHLLSRADRHDIYAKVDAVGGYTSSDLQRTVGGSDASGSTHTVSYNAAVRLGMNYYFPFMSALTPEIGLGVTGGRTKAFGISGENDDSINEKYDAASMHVAYADASLRWFQNWHPTLGTPLVKTLVAGGVRYNLNHSVDIGGSVGVNYSRGAVELPTTYQYLNTSLILDFTKNVSFTLGYVGVYDSTGHSHNATAKFEYSF